MSEIDHLAVTAQTDEQVLQQLIEQHQSYILRQASLASSKYITTSHDEWAIALQAFVQAVHEYRIEKGSFASFASLVIRRRMIDFLRSQTKVRNEIPVNPALFELRVEDEVSEKAMQSELAKKIVMKEEDSLKLEIQAIAPQFGTYGFTFFDLVDCSPKAEKTKQQCAKAITYLLEHPLLISEMRTSKLLPIKTIENHTELPRKMIERHRKYIIAVVEILSGEFPYLAEYLRTIKEEMSR